MAKCIVVWISAKQATIVSITDGVEKVLHVAPKAKGGMEADGPPEWAKYYGEVIRAIQDGQQIFIFGPAQAKMELKREIQKVATLSHRVLGTEIAEAITEKELVARAREFCRAQVVQ